MWLDEQYEKKFANMKLGDQQVGVAAPANVTANLVDH